LKIAREDSPLFKAKSRLFKTSLIEKETKAWLMRLLSESLKICSKEDYNNLIRKMRSSNKLPTRSKLLKNN